MEEQKLPEDPFEYAGQDRRMMNWEGIELRMRQILHEFKVELLKDLYERSINPLQQALNQQNDYCQQHTKELTEMHTLVSEIVEAKLIRRVQVIESQNSIIGKAMVVVGTAAFTSVLGILVLLLTHQIKL